MTKSKSKKQKAPKQSKVKSKSKDIVKTKDSPPIKLNSRNHKKQTSLQSKVQEVPKIVHDYSLDTQSNTYKIHLHQTYELEQNHPLYKQIKSLFALFLQKEDRREHQLHQVIPYSNFPSFQFKLKEEDPQEQKCSICQFEFEDKKDYQNELVNESDEDVVSLKCSHIIHKSCFKMLKGEKDWIKCPVCSTIFGIMIGDQPPGSMNWRVHGDMHCDGFPDVGTIEITYSMNAGKRGAINFPGTGRTAYLPDNKQGNEVLKLLNQAFNRKLIFTVGRSVTTGHDNRIVWNGIHHKTNLSGGSAYFGYPDDTYFQRLRLELAAKGIQ